MAQETQDQEIQMEEVEDPNLVSTNFYWTLDENGEIFNLQTTIRATLTPGQLAAHFETVRAGMILALGHGGKAKQVGRGVQMTKSETKGAGGQATTQPAQTEIAIDGAEGYFNPEWIEAEFNGSRQKWFYKLFGEPFALYGVRIWDEVIEGAGISLEEVQDAGRYKLEGGYVAGYTKNESGNPKQIVKKGLVKL